jgi:hypothetical protein
MCQHCVCPGKTRRGTLHRFRMTWLLSCETLPSSCASASTCFGPAFAPTPIETTGIPPQDFADTLLADAGPQRSPEEVEAERAHVFDLRIKALQVRNARAARSEEITRELANAEREISLLRTTERALASTLSKTEAEYKSLHAQYQEMQKRLRDAPPQITSGPELKQLAHDRDRTQEEIDRLKGELALEKAARIAAEERRDALQAELDKAEVELVRAGGSAFAVGTYDLQHQLLVALRSRRTRWGGLIGLVAVPAVTYGAPIYLGLVYHTLTSSQGFSQSRYGSHWRFGGSREPRPTEE